VSTLVEPLFNLLNDLALAEALPAAAFLMDMSSANLRSSRNRFCSSFPSLVTAQNDKTTPLFASHVRLSMLADRAKKSSLFGRLQSFARHAVMSNRR
jgi:hypothetical protein